MSGEGASRRFRFGRRTITVRHLDRVLFPRAGITRGDLLRHYLGCAPLLLPHLRARPLVMERYPEGIEAEGWFQQRPGQGMQAWVRRVDAPGERGPVPHVLCDDRATLAHLVDLGVIALHVWNARADRGFRPDRLILDLDPPGAPGSGSGEAAGERRGHERFLPLVRFATARAGRLMTELGLVPFLRTTGKRGYHVVVPLRPELGAEAVLELARRSAALLARRHPQALSVATRKSDRGARVFVDWLRNARGAVSVASWSVRVAPGAPVATPIRWEELETVAPDAFDVRSLPARIAAEGDSWRGLGRHARSPVRALRRLRVLEGEERP